MPALLNLRPALLLAAFGLPLIASCGNSSGSNPPPPITQLPGLRFAALDQRTFDAPVRQIVDLDGDGDLDVATQTAVLRNNGLGMFETEARGLQRPALFDFDGDGDIDRLQGNDALELVRNGPTPGDPILLRPADNSRRGRRLVANLDDDNRPDLLVLREQNGVQTLEAYRNQPGVELRLVQQRDWLIGFGVPTAIDFAVGDLDGDGDLDIAFLDNSRALVLALNAGSGMKFAPFRDRIQTTSTRVSLADFDGDDDLDVITHINDGAVLWRNQAQGRFELAGRSPYCTELLGAIDLTGDRLAELVVRRNGRTVVLQQGRNLEFDVMEELSSGGASATGRIFHDDLNGDGEADLVIGSTLLTARPGGYRNIATVNALAGLQLHVAAHGDINADGIQDLVAIDGNQLHTVFGRLDGSYRAAAIDPNWLLPTNALALEDLDGDGRPELIVAADGQDRILSWNTFRWLELQPRLPAASDDTRSIAVTDIDGDGWLDVTLVTTEDVKIHRNFGKGSSGAQRMDQVIGLERGSPPRIAFGDYDADGDPDALLPTTVLRNDDGRLVPTGEPMAVQPSPTTVALVDIDRDGDLDGLVLRSVAPVLLRNVNGVLLDDGRFLPNGSNLRGAARPLDLDADGDLDLLDDGQVFENTGIGTLEFTVRADWLPTGSTVLQAFDADGDRDIDLLDGERGLLRNLTAQLAVPRPAMLGSNIEVVAHGRLAGAMRSTLLLGTEVRPVPLPFGTLFAGGSTLAVLGTASIPTRDGRLVQSVPIPNDPRLRGAQLVFQSLVEATVQTTERRLTNAVAVTLH